MPRKNIEDAFCTELKQLLKVTGLRSPPFNLKTVTINGPTGPCSRKKAFKEDFTAKTGQVPFVSVLSTRALGDMTNSQRSEPESVDVSVIHHQHH
ncbi:hypothetical protein TYRP_013489 [Tyrophagus putrescentiae]|nr:hypothetical protein TYRP_013489 [Tyrophagus putrescentiae]